MRDVQNMIKIDRVIVVEGRYDKIKLASIFDATVIETNGFAIFKDKEKMKLLRMLAAKKGLLILTDSDAAGFKIRSYINGCIPKEQVVHAYIPDIFGKEKRKDAPSKEGKLGVEGVSRGVIVDALERAGVFCENTEKPSEPITFTDLYKDGFSGGKNSTQRRSAFLKYLNLPERMNVNAALQILNAMMSREEYIQKTADFEKTVNTSEQS